MSEPTFDSAATRLSSDSQSVAGHIIRDSGESPEGSPKRTRVTLRSLYEPKWLNTITSKYALVLVWFVMAAFYAFMMPDKFLSSGAFSSVFGSQQVLVFLAMSAMTTLLVGEFDLSIASVLTITATVIPVLAGLHGVNIIVACIVGLAAAALVGAINAYFVVVLDVSSLVVTLGTGTLLVGIAQALSNSNIVSVANAAFGNIALWKPFGWVLPISFYYGVGLAVLIAYILAYTPLGRHMLFVGANREVARLAGIRVQRIRAGAYIFGALLAGMAGMILVATVGGFDPSGGGIFLLPALAAVFLGTAVVQPGMFNPIGTLIAIYFLTTGIFGLQLMGFSGWIQNVFYGAGLVVAVTLAKLVRDRSRSA